MCGEFRSGLKWYTIGTRVPAFYGGLSLSPLWTSETPWIREESLYKGTWDHTAPKKCIIPAVEYTEKGCHFSVPQDMGILGLLCIDRNRGGRVLRILTRRSTPDEEEIAISRGFLAHDRHPAFISL